MQQIYKGTRMPKFDFNKVAEQASMSVLLQITAYFQHTFF